MNGYAVNAIQKVYHKKSVPRHKKDCRGGNSDQNTFNCLICSKGFNRKDAFTRHVKSCTNKDRNMPQCDICSKVWQSKWHLQRHMLSHQVEVICSDCGAVFNNQKSLNMHLKVHSEVEKLDNLPIVNFNDEVGDVLTDFPSMVFENSNEIESVCSLNFTSKVFGNEMEDSSNQLYENLRSYVDIEVGNNGYLVESLPRSAELEVLLCYIF